MGKIEKFEDIEMWQTARSLVLFIYRQTSRKPFSIDYGLKDQIQRAAVSVMSNIVEGFERGGNKEFLQFLYIAKASSAEVKSLSYVAFDLGYIDEESFNIIQNETTSVSRQISGLVKYLKNSHLKGLKNV